MLVLYMSFIYSSFIDWLKKILEIIKEFHCKYNVYLFFFLPYGERMHPACLFVQNGTLTVRILCIMYIIVRITYALEKTIYKLRKTIYGLERLFTD